MAGLYRILFNFKFLDTIIKKLLTDQIKSYNNHSTSLSRQPNHFFSKTIDKEGLI